MTESKTILTLDAAGKQLLLGGEGIEDRDLVQFLNISPANNKIN
jgi:hypothetical protein